MAHHLRRNRGANTKQTRRATVSSSPAGWRMSADRYPGEPVRRGADGGRAWAAWRGGGRDPAIGHREGDAAVAVGGRSTLVGRRDELAVVKRLLASSHRGNRWLEVAGDPGAGKSHLLAELRVLAGAASWTVLA